MPEMFRSSSAACAAMVLGTEMCIRDRLGQLGQLWDLVVELMIAEGGKVVAGLVHDIDQIRPARKRADRAALYRVAAVDQRNVIVRLLHLGLVRRNAGIAHAVGYAAVHVVGVQDDNCLLYTSRCV